LFGPLSGALGAAVTNLQVRAPEGWLPEDQASLQPSLTSRLEAALELGALRLVASPGVALYRAPRVVTINGETVFTVPRMVGTAVLDARWSP
jgi:hypothetical protein